MSLIRSTQSLDLLRKTNSEGNEADLVLTSFQLRKEQKDLINSLAKLNGERQATVVRAIIDEWRDMKLRDCGQE